MIIENEKVYKDFFNNFISIDNWSYGSSRIYSLKKKIYKFNKNNFKI